MVEEARGVEKEVVGKAFDEKWSPNIQSMHDDKPLSPHDLHMTSIIEHGQRW